MCSFYDDFEEIFHGTGKSEISFSLDGSVSNDYIKDENLQNDYFETSYAAEDVLTEPEMENVFHEDSNDEATTMADIENSPMQAFKKPRLDTTHSLRVEELRLQRERLEFEKLKLKQELDMKQREIDSQERLKILELEMKERISMNEIKMKERVALKALEKKWD